MPSIDVTHSYRGDLEVVAGVLGADGTDLCEPIELVTPDEDDSADNPGLRLGALLGARI